MRFENILDHNMELTEASAKNIRGKVNAFSKINSYSAVQTDSGWIVSVSEHRDNIGTISIADDDVTYYDSRGNTVHREGSVKYSVSKRSLENHYIPTLLMRVKSDDMFESVEHLQHICEQINEIASQGDYKAIGIMELSAFYAKATSLQKKQLQALIQQKDTKAVWDLVYQVTGMRI